MPGDTMLERRQIRYSVVMPHYNLVLIFSIAVSTVSSPGRRVFGTGTRSRPSY